MMDTRWPTRRLAVFGVSYFAVYMLYLWFCLSLENELTHWLTLVALPFAGLYMVARQSDREYTFRQLLDLVGLRRSGGMKAVFWGFSLGLLLGSLQLVLSNRSDDILQAVVTGKALYTFPQALLLMLVTAGFTEEFFFRGIVQSSLATAFRRQWLAVLIGAALFGLYHFPYAYQLESWSSHGDIVAALSEGVLMTAVIGLILGFVYSHFEHLAAPILVHAVFNACWAMTVMAI
jgi:membrane protease YdiL (CAAX protease family)